MASLPTPPPTAISTHLYYMVLALRSTACLASARRHTCTESGRSWSFPLLASKLESGFCGTDQGKLS